MRILLVVYGSLEQRTGGYRYDARLLRYLREKRHQVEVFSQSWGSYPGRFVQDAPGRLLEAVDRLGAELVLEDELNHPSLVRSNRALRALRGVPIVGVVHHLASCEEHGWIRGYLAKRIERAYLGTLDGAIYNTPVTRREVDSLRGGAVPGVVALPSSEGLRRSAEAARSRLEREERSPGEEAVGEGPRPFRILTVGALIRRKRIDAVIGALALLGDPGVELTIVGEGSAEPATARSLRALPRRLGVSRQVRFLGGIDQEQLAEEYEKHHLFVLPSQYEGFGMVYLEAMSHGLPVIGTSAGGAEAIITPGENGFLTRPGSSAGVARIVQRLQRDPGERHRLALGAAESARNHPTWDESFSQAEEYLLGVVEERRKNGS